MKNVMKILLPAIAAFALAGCAFSHPKAEPEPASPPAYTRIDVAGEVATPAEREACAAAGGEIMRAGLMGREHCIQRYPDAGKACNDEADCIGTCRYGADATAVGKPAVGTCQVTDDIFGCYATVDKGVVSPVLCVD